MPDREQIKPRTLFGIGLLVAAPPVFVLALWMYEALSCFRIPYLAIFAGKTGRLGSGLGEFGCVTTSESGSRLMIVSAAVATVTFGRLMDKLMSYLWRRGWRSAPFKHWRNLDRLGLASTIILLPALAAAAIGLRIEDGSLDLAPWAAFVATPLAWTGSALFVMSWILTFFAYLGTVGSNGTPQLNQGDARGKVQSFDAKAPSGLGVCVSGGGIRSGSVAMGALRELERTRIIRDHQHDRLVMRSLTSQIGIKLAAEQDLPDFDPEDVEQRARQSWSKQGLGSVLGLANYLASVSGGGYTAVAYQIARGIDPSPLDTDKWDGGTVFGVSEDRGHLLPAKAFDDPPRKQEGFSLRDHVLSRRKFLLAGRGGPLWSSLAIAAGIAIQLALISLAVFLIAWPLGRLARSWPVVDGAVVSSYRIQLRHITPSLLLAAVGTFCSLMTVMSWRTSRRMTSIRIAQACFGGSLFFGFLLIAVPLVTRRDTVPLLLSALGALTAVGGTATALAGRVMSAHLLPRVANLGGFLLAGAVVLVGLLVAREAASLSGTFGSTSWTLYYLVVLVMSTILWSTLDPRWWSLHVVYRNRLRAAFAVTDNKDKAEPRHRWTKSDTAAVFPLASRFEPVLSDYKDRLESAKSEPTPEPLICASVARQDRTLTGVTALSIVFSPRSIAFYNVDRDVEEPRVTIHECCTDAYTNALGPAATEGWVGGYWGRRRRSLGTMSTFMALSGAAVTSTMGRNSLGTTNALLAALNVRLGAWLPNPRYINLDFATDEENTQNVGPQRPTRFASLREYITFAVFGFGSFKNSARPIVKRSRLNYLVKEIFGGYDLDEPYLYVTDGGHRENLGLVELLRRRCKTIICIDASGDKPGSFSTFFQAARLAQTEVKAELKIRIAGGETVLDPLRTNEATGLADKLAVVIPVEYHSDSGAVHRANVIYAKAAAEASDMTLAAFHEEDPKFPNYSTGDQFLTEIQVRMLARLGGNMAKEVLKLAEQEDATNLIVDAMDTP